MVVRWAEEFQKVHPGVRFDIAAGGAGKGMADALSGVVDLGMVSREIYAEEIDKGAWWISVTRDAVVATVNARNPAIEELLVKGLSKNALKGIWLEESVSNWGQPWGSSRNDRIHVYTRSDACGAAKTWAAFLGGNQEDLIGIGVFGDPGVAEAVKKDPLGIGYNNISYAYDAETGLQLEGVRVVPLDLNGDGSLEKHEDFYATRTQIVDAIATGRYPSPPGRDLHLVSRGKPGSMLVLAFLAWVISDGQRYVSETGYIRLSDETLEAQRRKIEEE
jgi:phosphate transport system substrate-binding protein